MMLLSGQFQFLIGTLKTDIFLMRNMLKFTFQFLIGTLKTEFLTL